MELTLKNADFDLKKSFLALLVILMPLIVWLPVAWSEGYIALTSLTFLYYSYRDQRWDWLRKPWFLCFVLMWLFWLVRSCFVEDLHLSLQVVIPWIRFPLFTTACIWLYRQSPRHHQYFMWAAALLCSLIAADTLWQYYTGYDWLGIPKPEVFRLSGPLPKMRIGAIMSAIALPFFTAAACALTRDGWRNRRFWIWAGITALCAFAILVSGERTACLRVGLCVVLLWLFTPYIRRSIGILVLCAALAVGGILATHGNLVTRYITFSSHQLDTPKQNPYRHNWINAYELWKQHPIIGIGPKQYRAACPTLKAPKGLEAPICKKHPHGWLIQYLTEGGLISFSLLLAALYYAYRESWRQTGVTSAWISTGIAATIVNLGPLPMASFFAVWEAMPWFFMLSWAITSPMWSEHRDGGS